MLRALLKVDQHLRIGSDITVLLTDIDPRGIRLIARGRVLGGPNDGAEFEKVLEMTIGSSINLSPHIVLTLVKVRDATARLDVFVPAHVVVAKE